MPPPAPPRPFLQGYRAQKQREIGECVAYAESLRGRDGQFLTPKVANVFQEAVEDRRPAKGRGEEPAADPGGAEGPPDARRNLKTVLRAAVGKGHAEARGSGSSSYDSELSTGDDDDDGSRGSEFSRYSSEAERTGADSSTSSTRRRRRRRRKLEKTEGRQSSSSKSTATTSDRVESREERGKGKDNLTNRGRVKLWAWLLCQQ